MTHSWQVLCSSGTFSYEPDRTDPHSILCHGARLPVDGLEVIFYSAWYSTYQEVAEHVRTLPLAIPVIHAEKSIGSLLGTGQDDDRELALERFAHNCHFTQLVNARLIVLHLWGLPDSDRHIERNLAILPDCLDIAARYDIRLSVETIPCHKSDPLTITRHMIEREPACSITLDTEFLAYHNQLETALNAAWLWDNQCVDHIHIKDYGGSLIGPNQQRLFLQPGEGQINFDRFFEQLHKWKFAGSVSLEASGFDQDGHFDEQRLIRAVQLLRSYQQRDWS